MTTITAVKRALEETATEIKVGSLVRRALRTIADRPQAVTMLANRLSDRGDAGNAAVAKNLRAMNGMIEVIQDEFGPAHVAVLQWAIDQLTPPQVR